MFSLSGSKQNLKIRPNYDSRKYKLNMKEIRSAQRDLQQGTPSAPKSESSPSRPKKAARAAGLKKDEDEMQTKLREVKKSEKIKRRINAVAPHSTHWLPFRER